MNWHISCTFRGVDNAILLKLAAKTYEHLL